MEIKQPRQRKDNRRPDMEIYKPGLSRLRNKQNATKPETVRIDKHSEECRKETVLCRTESPQQNGFAFEGGETEVLYESPGEEEPSPPSDSCHKIGRRAKKPDRQIYQPSRRTQINDPTVDLDEEELLKNTDRLKITQENVIGTRDIAELRSTPTPLIERFHAPMSEYVKKGGKCSDDMLIGTSAVDEMEFSPTKRYSHSDKRRTRHRFCSTSSAGSSNSSGEGSMLTDCSKRRQERGKVSRERSRPKKQVSTSSTDSLDDDRMYTADGFGRERQHSNWGLGWRADSERKTSDKENRGRHQGSFQSRNSNTTNPGSRGAREDNERKKEQRILRRSDPSGKKSEGKELASNARGRGRGILVLPANTNLSATGSPESSNTGLKLVYGVSGNSKGARGRGRACGNRRLWDPNNPEQKPALKKQTSQLHFLDTDDEAPPSSEMDAQLAPSRPPQPSYYKFQNSDNPYYYPRPGMPGSQYSYGGYTLPYSVDHNNGMVAGSYYPGYHAPEHFYSLPIAGSHLSPEEMEQHVRTLQQQELRQLLRVADNQEVQLSNLLSRDRISPEGLEKMTALRCSYHRKCLDGEYHVQATGSPSKCPGGCHQPPGGI